MNDHSWAEDLPDNCPPGCAKQPNSEEFYRLVTSLPPTEQDFWSNRKLYPDREFEVDECRARSLSILKDHSQCIALRKYPTLKNKTAVKLVLPMDAGVIKRTGRKTHYSWWRRAGFDPIPICEAVESED